MDDKSTMSKILVIDSHKSSNNQPADNLHWQNARLIADMLGADLIWSYPTVNDNIVGGYEAIVFVHASPYAYTDYAWLQASPDAKLFYVTNEYNLGEPRTLWMAAKDGRRYTVLANHPAAISKVVKKYVDDWVILNLNALVFGNYTFQNDGDPMSCVYYGSFRKDRAPYFQKYLNDVTLSTHAKNVPKFAALGVTPNAIKRLNIQKGDLARYEYSLYIEDTITHLNYNFLANRFYEALNSGTVPIFDKSCERTLQLSGYADHIRDWQIIDDVSDLLEQISYTPEPNPTLLEFAAAEKREVIEKIHALVTPVTDLFGRAL